jgi:pimeloyl-ACP methyl ester carboxylesterase
MSRLSPMSTQLSDDALRLLQQLPRSLSTSDTPPDLASALCAEVMALAEQPPSKRKMTVIVVPGIVGTALSDAQRPIWIDVLRILEGHLGDLTLRPGATWDVDQDLDGRAVADGELISTAYGPLTTYLELLGYDVIACGFDWRRSIRSAAQRLREKIAAAIARYPGNAITIVGHSMGCLATIRAVHDDPAIEARIARAVFVAPPWKGSFVPLQAAANRYWLEQVVQLLLPLHDRQVSKFLCSLPGLAELMPDPAEFSGDWARFDPVAPPLSAYLPGLVDRAVTLRRELDAPAAPGAKAAEERLMKRSIIILGARRDTPINAHPGDKPSFTFTRTGDNTVPVRSAWDERATIYEGRWAHSFMTAEPRVFTGVARLLASEGTDALWLERLTTRPKDAEPSLPSWVLDSDDVLATLLIFTPQELDMVAEALGATSLTSAGGLGLGARKTLGSLMSAFSQARLAATHIRPLVESSGARHLAPEAFAGAIDGNVLEAITRIARGIFARLPSSP